MAKKRFKDINAHVPVVLLIMIILDAFMSGYKQAAKYITTKSR